MLFLLKKDVLRKIFEKSQKIIANNEKKTEE